MLAGGTIFLCVDGGGRYYTIPESVRAQAFSNDYVPYGSGNEAMRQLRKTVPVRLATTVASSLYTDTEGLQQQ